MKEKFDKYKMNLPVNKHFKAVNDFVFASHTEFEDLQNACIMLATSLETARNSLTQLRYATFETEELVNELIDKTLKAIQ